MLQDPLLALSVVTVLNAHFLYEALDLVGKAGVGGDPFADAFAGRCQPNGALLSPPGGM